MDAETLGIPALDLAMQIESLTLPCVPYGSLGRGRPMAGTYHFYTADRRFTRLIARPDRIFVSGCVAAIEPNFSTGPDCPLALVLWGVYQKRRIARFWQDSGLAVAVDLNVDRLDVALLGVPQGWQSYATRWHRKDTADVLERTWALATCHADPNPPRMIVFGGGPKVRTICETHGWTYVPENCRMVRGLEPANGRA